MMNIQTIINKILWYYHKYENYAQITFFFGGFLWDNLTLTRIDRLSDNIILFLYIALMGFFIILMNLSEVGRLRRKTLKKYSEWYPLAIQFLQGGLFSSYVVFYFKSASLTKTIIFVVILGILLVANEFLEKKLANVKLQFILFFLVNFSFFAFFLPVLFKKMSSLIFYLSGSVSMGIILVYLWLFQGKLCLISRRQAVGIGIRITALFVLLNFFYWQNWIPPVPLSLKEAGVYHSVRKTGHVYDLKFQKPRWFQFWKRSDDPFFYANGDTVYCFSAVFAPTRLRTRIYHHWQFFDARSKRWETTDKLGFPLTGGRNGGYRGYTYKTHIADGRWRIDVEAADGAVVGRINFRVIHSPAGERQFVNRKD